jgi:hypothetical protein
MHADPLQQLLAQPRESSRTVNTTPDAAAIVIGKIHSVSEQPRAAITVSWRTGPEHAPQQVLAASSLVAVTTKDIGRSVALSFPSNATQALVLGFVWDAQSHPEPTSKSSKEHRNEIALEMDGEQVDLELHAERSLSLHCGKASITLTADGQILLKGAYISSHSTGTQRIKGAAVRIN